MALLLKIRNITANWGETGKKLVRLSQKICVIIEILPFVALTFWADGLNLLEWRAMPYLASLFMTWVSHFLIESELALWIAPQATLRGRFAETPSSRQKIAILVKYCDFFCIWSKMLSQRRHFRSVWVKIFWVLHRSSLVCMHVELLTSQVPTYSMNLQFYVVCRSFLLQGW